MENVKNEQNKNTKKKNIHRTIYYIGMSMIILIPNIVGASFLGKLLFIFQIE